MASKSVNPAVFDSDKQFHFERTYDLSIPNEMFGKYFINWRIECQAHKCARTTIDGQTRYPPAPIYGQNVGVRPPNVPGQPVAYTDADWKKHVHACYLSATNLWNAEKPKHDALWDLSSSILFALLWAKGQANYANLLMEDDPFVKFTNLMARIKRDLKPDGAYAVSQILKELPTLNDKRGMIPLFESLTRIDAELSIADPNSLLTEQQKKDVMISQVTNKHWQGLLMDHKDDALWTYDHCETVIRDQIRCNRSMEVIVDTSPLPDNNKSQMNAASLEKALKCFNCGKTGHGSEDCPSLSCNSCKKTYDSLQSPGRHTSANCPKRIAEKALKDATAARGGGRGRGAGGPGGRAGRGGRGRGPGGGRGDGGYSGRGDGGRFQGNRGRGGRGGGGGRAPYTERMEQAAWAANHYYNPDYTPPHWLPQNQPGDFEAYQSYPSNYDANKRTKPNGGSDGETQKLLQQVLTSQSELIATQKGQAERMARNGM